MNSIGGQLCRVGPSAVLPFNRDHIEEVILSISDRFNFRVVMADGKVTGAVLLTTGLAIAGGLLGRYYGGKVGATVGSVTGGALGAGCVIVTMRSVWQDIKEKLSALYEMVYNFLSELGLDDYVNVATFLLRNGRNAQLGKLILEKATEILGKKILSNLAVA